MSSANAPDHGRSGAFRVRGRPRPGGGSRPGRRRSRRAVCPMALCCVSDVTCVRTSSRCRSGCEPRDLDHLAGASPAAASDVAQSEPPEAGLDRASCARRPATVGRIQCSANRPPRPAPGARRPRTVPRGLRAKAVGQVPVLPVPVLRSHESLTSGVRSPCRSQDRISAVGAGEMRSTHCGPCGHRDRRRRIGISPSGVRAGEGGSVASGFRTGLLRERVPPASSDRAPVSGTRVRRVA